ncbi:MAG: hypothetical protein KC414_14465, partial [Romboutsia sp.]|nr:hypothetical protein [Romboutsia sp.]
NENIYGKIVCDKSKSASTGNLPIKIVNSLNLIDKKFVDYDVASYLSHFKDYNSVIKSSKKGYFTLTKIMHIDANDADTIDTKVDDKSSIKSINDLAYNNFLAKGTTEDIQYYGDRYKFRIIDSKNVSNNSNLLIEARAWSKTDNKIYNIILKSESGKVVLKSKKVINKFNFLQKLIESDIKWDDKLNSINHDIKRLKLKKDYLLKDAINKTLVYIFKNETYYRNEEKYISYRYYLIERYKLKSLINAYNKYLDFSFSREKIFNLVYKNSLEFNIKQKGFDKSILKVINIEEYKENEFCSWLDFSGFISIEHLKINCNDIKGNDFIEKLQSLNQIAILMEQEQNAFKSFRNIVFGISTEYVQNESAPVNQLE